MKRRGFASLLLGLFAAGCRFGTQPERIFPLQIRRICCLFLFLLLAAVPAAVLPEETGKSYALLIGVGAYQQWSTLINPITDVRALAAELKARYGFRPEVLENPTREEILAKLRRYFQIDYGPRDQLVVVFAGHGTYDEVSRIGYLVASDSEDRQRDPNFVSLVNYPWLLTLIDNIDCPNVLLVVDACYSGSLTDHGGAAPAAGAGNGRVRRFLTSGGKEYVPDGDPGRHTPFMRQLLAGLRSPGEDRVFSLAELQDRFMNRVEPRPRWGSFGDDEGKGDFAFVVRGSGTVEPAPFVAAEAAPAKAPLAEIPSAVLRAEPKKVSGKELERAFKRLDIFDKTRSPEGDFPNYFQVQSHGIWEVVMDLESSLTWQQSGSDHRMSYEEALGYVEQLNRDSHAGFIDWRLPTIEELASLVEPMRLSDGFYISPHFDPLQITCWSADRDRESGDTYYVSFNSGLVTTNYKDDDLFVRAVRSH